MVERSLSMWEVGGSIPPVSNKSFEDNCDQLLLDFFLVLYRKAIYAPALSTILVFCKAEIGNQDLHTFNQFRLCIFRISYWCWYLGLGVLVIQGRRSLFKIEGLRPAWHLKWANYICPWKRFSVFFQVSFGIVSLYALINVHPAPPQNYFDNNTTLRPN